MKLLFSFLTMLIVSLSFVSNSFAAPTPPVMSHSTNGARVDITWTEVSGATGYTLLYAPSPYAGPKTIQSKDMGAKTSLSANLWDGAAYYVAVQAYNEQGNSGYSNIELLKIETISAPKLSVSTDGVTVSLSWDSVPGATGYLLNYGPSPFAGPESFITKDVGLTTNFSTDLWDGAAFSVAVQAYNDSGISDFSNIELFTINANLLFDLDNLWPDTGQLKCYDSNANVIDCSEGQDGGRHENELSYWDYGNGTILDKVTGLVWQKANTATSLSWDEAKEHCEALNVGQSSSSNWILPTRRQLLTLVDYAGGKYSRIKREPRISKDYFNISDATNFWTQTEDRGDSFGTRAWYVDFVNGWPSTTDKYKTSNATAKFSALCVQGRWVEFYHDPENPGEKTEEAFSAPPWPDGTITSLETGRMWRDSSSSMPINSFQEALNYCNDSTFAGYTNWRLPNIRELASLTSENSAFKFFDLNRTWYGGDGDRGYELAYWWSSTWYFPFTGASPYIFTFTTNIIPWGSNLNNKVFVRCVRD